MKNCGKGRLGELNVDDLVTGGNAISAEGRSVELSSATESAFDMVEIGGLVCFTFGDRRSLIANCG